MDSDGTCHCGCGQPTTAYRYDDPKTGKKAGEHRAFAHGHWHNLKRKENPRWGEQSRRNQRLEQVRRQLAEAANKSRGKTTIEALRAEIAPDVCINGISRMLTFAKEMHEVCGFYPDVPPVALHPPKQVRPPYERPEIAYEVETELPYLSRRRHCVSLDATHEDSDEPMHSYIASTNKTPLDILMEKEEEPERMARQSEIHQFEKFQSKKQFGIAA